MKKALQLATLASLVAVTACTMETQDEEAVGSASSAVEEFDPRDALLAALGSATLDCLGTMDSKAYTVDATGRLRRTFKECVMKGQDRTLKQIDSILGVQGSKYGQKDELAKHYSTTWQAYQKNAPESGVCPRFDKVAIHNPPNKDTVKKHVNGEIGKTNFTYKVDGSKYCKPGAAKCNAEAAVKCLGGSETPAFGSQFLISADGEKSTVLVDPVWWLWNDTYPEDSDNPFMTPGYYHAMSYYGRVPGDRYGALAREGEQCSRYDEVSGKHYIHYLYAIECSPGWYCMTYCM